MNSDNTLNYQQGLFLKIYIHSLTFLIKKTQQQMKQKRNNSTTTF